MTVGELYLEAVSSGVITESETSWLVEHQQEFSRLEEATALRLGRLLDAGRLQLGCRLPARLPGIPCLRSSRPGGTPEG